MSWTWTPDPEQANRTNVHRFMERLGFAGLEEFLIWSREQPEAFWKATVEETGISWMRPFSAVLDDSRGPEWSQWFTGGQLNIASNCLERHIARPSPALIWEGEDGASRSLTFSELDADASQVAHALLRMGIVKGDRVALCLPLVPEVVAALYGCFKIGAIVTPIFSGFGAGAVRARLIDSGARVLITADAVVRRGKPHPLKDKLDEAVEGSSVERVVVVPYCDLAMNWIAGRDLWWEDWLLGESPAYVADAMDSEDPCLLLYTSGTTGKPKGCVHTHAGALAQISKEMWLAFDHQDEDRFFWLTDMGWMMGPWTVIGNHHFGGTVFLYDGAPDYPGPHRLWEMIERHRITTFGVSPTAIRMLMKAGVPPQTMPSLRLLGSTGEPWDETSWLWYFENIGRRRCPVINICGGTEIVGCFLFPLPVQPLKPCSLGQPAPGMAVAIVNEDGSPAGDRMGHLVCQKPAPSMTRGVWGQPQRYIETYWSRWPGWWNHGDWASVDADGAWFVHGRADESMNVAGRKVGPAEVEDSLLEHPDVAEAAVVGVPDPVKGETIVAFVVPRPGVAPSADWVAGVVHHLVHQMGAVFRPSDLRAVSELPKTQSGKIVRRLVRQQYLGEPLGDTSTVQNPGALDQFTKGR